MFDLYKSIEFASKGCEEVMKCDNYLEAIGLLSKAIELNPKDFRFHAIRSHVFYRLKQFSFALIDAKNAVKLNDKCAVSHIREASALNALHRYSEAEVAAKRAIHLRPDKQLLNLGGYELLLSRKMALISMGFDSEDVLKVLPKCRSIREGYSKLMHTIHTRDF